MTLPFLVKNLDVASSRSPTANNARLASGFTLSLDPTAILNDVTKVRGVRLRAINPDSVDGSVDQWNLGLQRELGASVVVTLDYVGTKGTHLSTLRNFNQPLFNSNRTVKDALVNGA